MAEAALMRSNWSVDIHWASGGDTENELASVAVQNNQSVDIQRREERFAVIHNRRSETM